MNKTAFRYFLCLILSGSIFSRASAQLNTKATTALIERIIPGQAGHFEIKYIPKEDNEDVFEIQSVDGKIVLRGNDGVSVASALYYYLRHYCHCLITWEGTNLKLPDTLPVVEGIIHKTSPYHYRYYLNYCTFSYTMAWWDWDRWQKEIDWMALNGINMPLAITGEAAVWQKVYKQMGFTDDELSRFFSGPAYFAWLWMGNLDAWGGPLPQHWIDTHEALQKKILARERALGMTPVLPAFTGHVPPSFSKRFPGAKVNKINWYGHFADVDILNPADSLFTIVGKKYLEEQTKIYGTDHLYSADIFNEMKPPSGDSLYLDHISKKVYQSMHIVDTAAIWVMQGWLFHNDSKFWQPAQIKALLNGIADNKMIILDLWSERHPIWNKTDAFYGKQWIWNMLHNFGGNIYLGGCMPCVADQPASLLNTPDAGKLAGIGLTMEGTMQNPALYQLMLDNTWRHQKISLKNWVKSYVHERYGILDKNAVAAWDTLLHTVYAHPDKGNIGGSESIITGRPTFNKNTGHTYTKLDYNPEKLFESWKLLLKAGSRLKGNDAYQFDLVDVNRQVLADYADLVQQQIAKAYKEKDIFRFRQESSRFLSLINDINKLLGTRREFLLGTWLSDARSWGITNQEKNLYEFNARDQITLWGPKDCTLYEYACKQWNGLLGGFYEPRWEQFFKYALKCLRENKPFDQQSFDKKIKDWEWHWVHQHQKYPDHPQGDPVKVSEELFNKYSPIIKNKQPA